MSNGRSQSFSHDSVVGSAAMPAGGAFLGSADFAVGVSSGIAADAASQAQKPVRLGMGHGDIRGLLPDLAGIAVLVTALGAYGGFW
jgi:hypothetical protein